MKKLLSCGVSVLMLLMGFTWMAVTSKPVQAQPSAQAYYPAYAKSNLAANATTQIRTGAGVLHAVCINTKGAASNTVTIYDNTASSGTTIGIIDSTVLLGCFTYDAAFGTGLRVVIGTGTAPDITFTYRALN